MQIKAMTTHLESYFAELHTHLATARRMKHRRIAEPNWSPEPARCHANVDHWVRSHPGLRAVRGWVVISEDESGACYYAAHSVIEEDGQLFDITIRNQEECESLRFVEHVGPQDEFWAVERVCCQAWYPTPILDLSEGETDITGEEEADSY